MSTSPGWAVLSLGAGGLLYLLLKGRRFGPRRAPGRLRRRSKLEFVDAVGGTYRAAGAHRLALEMNYHDLSRRLANRLGLAAPVTARSLAVALARRAQGLTAAQLAALEESEAALQQTRVSHQKLMNLYQKLGELEAEVFHVR